MIDALRGQQAQLKRLLAQKVWISSAPKATLTEMDAQVTQIKGDRALDARRRHAQEGFIAGC